MVSVLEVVTFFVFLKGKILMIILKRDIGAFLREASEILSRCRTVCMCSIISLADFHWSFQNRRKSSFALSILGKIEPLLSSGFWLIG